MLRVDLEDFEGNTAYAEYKKFGVMSENEKYKLILSSYSGESLRFLSAQIVEAIALSLTQQLKRPNPGIQSNSFGC